MWQTSKTKTYDYSLTYPSFNSIINNIREHIEEGNKSYENKKYTAATNLYFKALVAIYDYVLLAKHGVRPKNHDEMFEFLKLREPYLYRIYNKCFNIYRSAYEREISEEECEELRNTVFSLLKKYSIPLHVAKDLKSNYESTDAEIEIFKKETVSAKNSYKEETKKEVQVESPGNLNVTTILGIKETLKELKNLYDEGLITEEEYEQKKRELLSRL